MNCPHCEIPFLTFNSLEQTARCDECGSAWETVLAEAPLYQGNLIYLPFARHLADEEGARGAVAA